MHYYALHIKCPATFFKDLVFSIQDNILCSTNVMVAFPDLVRHPATRELIADIRIHDKYSYRQIILTICRIATIVYILMAVV